MKVYQYIFRDNDSCDMNTIQSASLYEANKLAYAEYLTWWKEGETEDFFGDPKESFVEFCKHYADRKYGGHCFENGSLDIMRNDFEIDT